MNHKRPVAADSAKVAEDSRWEEILVADLLHRFTQSLKISADTFNRITTGYAKERKSKQSEEK